MDKKKVDKFHPTQPTANFSIAPQREEYEDDNAHDHACLWYAIQWRQEYDCGECGQGLCPQCDFATAAAFSGDDDG